MLNGLDVFSGIGGLAIALEEWVRPLAYCEIDLYCRGVLMSQMARGSICKAPIWDDVTTLRGADRVKEELGAEITKLKERISYLEGIHALLERK